MKISWNWLREYLDLKATPEEVANRLAMAGLNHESTVAVGDDLAIELEVTSNRADCLGHLGVAREVAALWQTKLRIPELRITSEQRPRKTAEGRRPVEVRIEASELCSRYIARVIRGVKIAPSPKWLTDRLRTIDLSAINNVVDVTNYVMMECGQPLHAFDLARLRGACIIVRRARPREPFVAIDHKQYELEEDYCVIADVERPVALAGVMGGADSEVTDGTIDLLIEAADFDPISVRSTSHRLKLSSPSSHRFERGVDPQMVDWASRRACEMIIDLAGGELVGEAVDCVGDRSALPSQRPTVTLRWSQLPRVLGIDPGPEVACDILKRLGLTVQQQHSDSVVVQVPSWRRDLTREIDLIEEVARIHGYDKIPEDARVPMTTSQRTRSNRVLARVRHAMHAGGFDEALTPSVVDERTSEGFSPWCSAPALRTLVPLLRGADQLRRSLVPSLLIARRTNESLSNRWIELYEVAKVYWPRRGELPEEPLMLGLTSGREFLVVKGILQAMVRSLGINTPLTDVPIEHPMLAANQSIELALDGRTLGMLGVLSPAALKQFDLRGPVVVAELRLDPLIQQAILVPLAGAISSYPPVEFDLNLVVPETLRWRDLEATVTAAAGPDLESLAYLETYRDTARDGADRKRILLTATLRAADRTLTGDESEQVRARIVEACRVRHDARLLAG